MKLLRAILFALAWMAPMLSALGDPSPVCIAVISDAENKDLATLVTTELSSNPDISLVERNDLAKIGDELKLQRLAGSDAVALGKLIGADGLIFLSKGPNGLAIRFTAIGLGYALFDDQIASETDLPQLAKSIAHRVTGYAPKLKLDPAKAIPISVLNLRADYATRDSTALERKLTLLLESRLASLPEYVVLERRHAWSLGFEHSLSNTPKPFLQGAYVVDGTLSLLLQEQAAGDVTIHLRLRSPANQQTPLEIEGPITDLPSLVEKMTAEIQKATGDQTPSVVWDSQTEAHEYFLEGLWGYEHGASDAALEALDSAELLGDKTPDLVPIRIGLLSRRASQALDQARQESSAAAPDAPSSPDQMIDDTLQAIFEAARYESEKLEPKLQRLSWLTHFDVRTDQIKEDLTNFTTDELAYLDAQHSPRADELRLGLRAVSGYDPLHGKLGRADYSHPLNVQTRWDGDWDISLEEELAYYHLLCSTPNQFIPSSLLTVNGDGFCRRFLKDPEEQKRAYAQFVQDLKNDPKGRLTYELIRSCSPDPVVADAAYTAYWQEMWNRREDLVSQKVQVEEWTTARPVTDLLRHKHANEMIPVLRYYLTHVNNFRYWEYSWETMWQPDQWSEADAAAIWADYLGFKQRAEADWFARVERAAPLDLSQFEQPFEKKFPQIAAMTAPQSTPEPVSTPEPLVVHGFWHPGLASNAPKASWVQIDQCQAVNDALWMTGWYPGGGAGTAFAYKITIPDLKATEIAPQLMRPGLTLLTSPQAIYLDFSQYLSQSVSQPVPPNQRHISRLDLKTQVWEARTLDFSYRRSFAVNDSLYFDLNGGIGRYDWDTAEFTLLASSRRRPARNQFDDCDPNDYAITNIFPGPGGRPCVTMGNSGTFYIQDQPGNWPDVFDSTWGTESVTSQNTTLVYSRNGEAVLLDPARAEPDYLMAPTQPFDRKIAAFHQEPVKQMTPWAGRTRWDAALDYLRMGSSVAGDDHRLCVFLAPDRKRKVARLLWYDENHGRNPCVIPLQFVMDAETRALLAPIFNGKEGDRLTIEDLLKPANLGLVATREGICLIHNGAGVWFLPYRDIEAYLKIHPRDVLVPIPTPDFPSVTIPPPEDDAESQVIGDMIDPAVPNSFR